MASEKITNTAKKLETGANAAIIIVVLMLAAVFAKNYLGNRKPAHLPQAVTVGAKLGLKDLNWQANGQGMVFALSTTCHFCTESAGFYQELIKKCRAGHLRTIAVLPQPLSEARSYLGKVGVNVDEVLQVPLSDMRVSGTPTLLLVDQKGTVQAVWYGKLSSSGEKEVLAKISSLL